MLISVGITAGLTIFIAGYILFRGVPNITFELLSTSPSYLTVDADGVHYTTPEGTEEEMAALASSVEHLGKMRDEIIALGIIPAVEEWTKENPNL